MRNTLGDVFLSSLAMLDYFYSHSDICLLVLLSNKKRQHIPLPSKYVPPFCKPSATPSALCFGTRCSLRQKKYHTIGGNHSAFAFANIVQSLDINKRCGENVCVCGVCFFCPSLWRYAQYIFVTSGAVSVKSKLIEYVSQIFH